MSVEKAAAVLSAVVFVAAVAAGLVVSGSPGEQRLRRFDDQRVSDLMELSRALDAYWDSESVLPASLDLVVDGRRLTRVPVDPATDAAYEYLVDAPDAYRLCADFARPSGEDARGDFWAHEAGRACFSFSAGRDD